MGLAEIEQIIANARRMPDGQGVADRLDAARKGLAAQAQAFVERQHELYASGSGKALREEMLAKKALNADGGIDPVDLLMMQALVRRMAKRLADRYSRRRHTANRGHLDVRKTLRKSMAHGGVPFEFEWKIKKVDMPSIVAICDVSKSVAAAAQFLLTFLYSLNDVVDHLDAYAFSGRLISVNDILDDNGVEGAILKVLQQIGFQQTDYGRALQDFSEQHLDRLDRRTTVIFLGDGRSNFADPRLDLMREIHDRSRAVIWLNPLFAAYVLDRRRKIDRLMPRGTSYSVGDILAAVARYRFIVTDTYHVCVNSWRAGTPAICFGSPEAAVKHLTLDDYKKRVLYETYDASDFYFSTSSLRSPGRRKAALDKVRHIIGDERIAKAITARIHAHARSVEHNLAARLSELAGH